MPRFIRSLVRFLVRRFFPLELDLERADARASAYRAALAEARRICIATAQELRQPEGSRVNANRLCAHLEMRFTRMLAAVDTFTGPFDTSDLVVREAEIDTNARFERAGLKVPRRLDGFDGIEVTR